MTAASIAPPEHVVIEIHGLVAPNPLNRGMHWGSKARIARRHHEAVASALAGVSLPPAPWRVLLVRIAPRTVDRHDALPASLKHVADAACLALHVDDADPRVAFAYAHERGPCAVRITIQHATEAQ